MYKIVVADLGSTPMEEIPVQNLQYSYSLNRPGSCSFSMLSEHPKCTRSLLDPGKRELLVYRDDTIVWGGYLWAASTEGNGDTVRFAGDGYLSRFDRRYIDALKNYNDVDQLDIAWDLIDFTQAQASGDLGIQRYSADSSGILRDRVYNAWERKNVGESLRELAAVIDGFDFEIDAQKQWKTYYPRKMSGQSYKWETGKSIRGWSCIIGAEKVATEVTALGEGEGATMKTSVRDDDAAILDFGILEDTFEFRDVNVQATLDAHAEEELRLAKVQQIQPQIQVYTNEPPLGAYATGDMAHLKIDQGYIQLDDDFRITSITVAVSNEGNEAIGVFFGEEGQL